LTETLSLDAVVDSLQATSRVISDSLRKTLYSRYYKLRPPLRPEELALELYARFYKEPFIIIWSTDTAEEILNKVDSLKTAAGRPVVDAVSGSIITELADQLRGVSHHTTEAMYSARELYVQLREFETPGLGRFGLVYVKGWDRDFLDTELRRKVGKTYTELFEEVHGHAPAPIPPPPPTGRPIGYIFVTCDFCRATYSMPFTSLGTTNGQCPDLVQDLSTEPEMVCCAHPARRLVETSIIQLVEDV